MDNIITKNTVDLIGFDKLDVTKKLKIKTGFDPTSKDIHLGHTILLNKLKNFQELGHDVIIVIGDFTAMIGDPTGKNITRKQLSKEEVLENSETYQKQIFKILDKDKTNVVYNSDWLGKLSSIDMINLCSKYSLARMLERNDFSNRYKNNEHIAIHEFIYPLLQGYDSVFLKSDIEIGGTDQLFNLMVGRHLQELYGQKPQAVMTLPILEGLDGVQKMSKSLNNYIGVEEEPNNIFGKVMSISDELMIKYYDLLDVRNPCSIKNKILSGTNPKNVKLELAHILVKRFYNKDIADQCLVNFENRFKNHINPDNIETLIIKSNIGIKLPNLLKEVNLVKSTSDAIRLIKAGAVKINNEKVIEPNTYIDTNTNNLYSVGKLKITKINIIDY